MGVLRYVGHVPSDYAGVPLRAGEMLRATDTVCHRLLALQPDVWEPAEGWLPEERAIAPHRLKSLPPPSSGAGGYGDDPTRSAGSIPFSWVIYVGANTWVKDVSVGGIDQHISVDNNQVLLLPFVVCQYLLANFPALWMVQTVIPLGVPFTTDGPTGLDIIYANSSDPWGVTTTPWGSTIGFFDPYGPSSGDPGQLFLDNLSQPYIAYF